MIENATKSAIVSKSIIKENEAAYVSTQSNTQFEIKFYRATFSNIATKSIATRSLIQGDIDIYGNIIEYNPNDWIGEDNIVDDNVNIKNIFSVQNDQDIGVLDISLSDDLTKGKSNILVSLIDEGYNISNIYIYYRNDYHEKVKLVPGKYKINNVEYLANNNILIEADLTEFEIKKDETLNLQIHPVLEKIVIATTSDVKDNKNALQISKNDNMPIFIYVILVLSVVLLGLLIFTFVRRIINKGDE